MCGLTSKHLNVTTGEIMLCLVKLSFVHNEGKFINHDFSAFGSNSKDRLTIWGNYTVLWLVWCWLSNVIGRQIKARKLYAIFITSRKSINTNIFQAIIKLLAWLLYVSFFLNFFSFPFYCFVLFPVDCPILCRVLWWRFHERYSKP